jgi:hypothetical protein
MGIRYLIQALGFHERELKGLKEVSQRIKETAPSDFLQKH